VKQFKYLLMSVAVVLLATSAVALVLSEPAGAANFTTKPAEQASDFQLTISPTVKGSVTSIYVISNQSVNMATTLHTFYDQNDTYVHDFSDSITSEGSKAYNLDTMAGLTEGYIGYVIVSSDQPITYTLDADGDSVFDDVEGSGDADGDGIPNNLDLDADDDGILDANEWRSGSGDDFCADTTLDTDDDGTPNCQDNDVDGDGTANFLDTDSDGDGIPDESEGTGDNNGNGIPDFLDPNGTAQYQLTISPTMKGGLCTSVYTVTNEGSVEATTQHVFYNQEEAHVHDFVDSVAVGASNVYNLDTVGGLTEGYTGYVIVSADQPVTYTLDACPSAPPPPPDLSPSQKWVNLTSVDEGDVLTYTLLLRNDSVTSATAALTDPLPAHTTYVPDSAKASDGTEVMTAGGEIRWSGRVISGTPVIVQFASVVTTTGMAPGNLVTNTAHLDDGAGSVVTLEAQSTYNPGYGVTINNGESYINIPTVTLSISWGDEDPDITKMWISNDGGSVGGTDWISVDGTYPGWVLDTQGDRRMPRTVYVKFRDADGAQYGPIQDDIFYDPVPPQVTEIEIITDAGSLQAMAGQDVIVRVTSSDDNVGTSKAHVSHDDAFETYSAFEITGNTTDIPWTLQPSGEVYVRVVDRAGNVSEIKSEQGRPNYPVFLPLVLRRTQ
jgi:uncharacterized repeat protein (TIGR01451 family)